MSAFPVTKQKAAVHEVPDQSDGRNCRSAAWRSQEPLYLSSVSRPSVGRSPPSQSFRSGHGRYAGRYRPVLDRRRIRAWATQSIRKSQPSADGIPVLRQLGVLCCRRFQNEGPQRPTMVSRVSVRDASRCNESFFWTPGTVILASTLSAAKRSRSSSVRSSCGSRVVPKNFRMQDKCHSSSGACRRQ